MDKNERVYYVKKLRLLNFLVNTKGLKDYEVIPDPTSTKGYNWFVYRYTPELHEALDEYFAQFK